MNTQHWTDKDVADFIRFIRSKGGEITEYSSFIDGSYEFSVKPPKNSPQSWGKEQMKEFEAKR